MLVCWRLVRHRYHSTCNFDIHSNFYFLFSFCFFPSKIEVFKFIHIKWVNTMCVVKLISKIQLISNLLAHFRIHIMYKMQACEHRNRINTQYRGWNNNGGAAGVTLGGSECACIHSRECESVRGFPLGRSGKNATSQFANARSAEWKGRQAVQNERTYPKRLHERGEKWSSRSQSAHSAAR